MQVISRENRQFALGPDVNEHPARSYRLISVQPIAGALGAEIHGVDLSQMLSDAAIAELRQALLDHCVIFFRNQSLTVDQHKRFARGFGEIFIHPNFAGTGPDPEIVEVRREPGDKMIVGEDWHTDTTMVESPPMGAILYAIEAPPFGGDTMFANQYLAYDTLSDGMKSMLSQLRAVHSDRNSAGPNSVRNKYRATKVRADADWRETISVHPVIRTHPETGRKLLFVNRAYTLAFEDMSESESKPLLDYLFAHGNRLEFTCRFRWETGSVAFWDNRCTRHIALHDAGQHRRVMRRVQIAGDRPH
jgi:taurine dioxygenase